MDKSAVYLAAECNQSEILSLLCKNVVGRDMVNRQNRKIHKNKYALTCFRYMKTPLHVAAQKGLESIVSFLLKNGADADAKDEEEQTALHLAAQNVKMTKQNKNNCPLNFRGAPVLYAISLAHTKNSSMLKTMRVTLRCILRPHMVSKFLKNIINDFSFGQ